MFHGMFRSVINPAHTHSVSIDVKDQASVTSVFDILSHFMEDSGNLSLGRIVIEFLVVGIAESRVVTLYG